jgi:hypothetical protein
MVSSPGAAVVSLALVGLPSAFETAHTVENRNF